MKRHDLIERNGTRALVTDVDGAGRAKLTFFVGNVALKISERYPIELLRHFGWRIFSRHTA